ncbi:MAG: acetyl-CoA decarbonylase/synthase complex subunit gamma [Chitinivibrionales bacterium]|nr:acetyl-CoA decarbonylase/synthase complex subunit gamma [Chitinivibrionales bacterium]
MALTAMQIYKSLPKTNCKECGFPTCMAFAMQVAAKKKALADCPHASDDARSSLADASTPPMRLVKIGPAGKQFTTGQETVMFRHEEKFHHPTAIAVRIGSSLSLDDALLKVEKINASVFERVGQKLNVELCAVELDGCDDSSGRAKSIADKCSVPLILVSKDAATMKAAAESIKDNKPLLFGADNSTAESFAEIAAQLKCPMTVSGDSIETVADAAEKAKNKGVQDIVLAFDGREGQKALQNLTIARRAALKKNFKALGYPTCVDVHEENTGMECSATSAFAAKYAGIVIIDNVEPSELISIMTVVQDIYTDPQKPNMVEAGVYEIGSPDENSPVLFTTNFSLTYFSVAGEVERSKIPAYISVVDTEGLGVLNAYAGDKISVEKIIKAFNEQKLADKVKHRKLIIPGLLPIYKAEIEETSEWKEVLIGPENASKIPSFLNEAWK